MFDGEDVGRNDNGTVHHHHGVVDENQGDGDGNVDVDDDDDDDGDGDDDGDDNLRWQQSSILETSPLSRQGAR